MMKSVGNKNRLVRAAVLTLGAVFCILPGNGQEWGLVYCLSPWIWILCFLFYTRTLEKKREWLVFAVILLAAYEVRYRHFMGDSALSFMIASDLLLVVLSIAAAIPFILDRFYCRYGYGPLKVLMFPAARIVLERFITGQQFNLSLTQFDNKWLIQSVSVFGDVFITFIVSMVPSAVIFLVLNREDRKACRIGTIMLAAGILPAVLGGFRYHTAPRAEAPVKMAYASGPQKTYYEDPSDTDPGYAENLAYLTRTVEEAARSGAKLIAYSEEAYIVSAEEEKDITEAAQALARENDIYILLSLDSENESGEFVNKAVFIGSEGEYLSDYTKTNLIPVVETDEYTPGDGHIPSNRITIDGRELVISYTICYDATFYKYLLTMDPETDLFINPSWDWDEIDDLNYRMQAISAIENGIVLFKPTVDGWSIVTDPYGRITYKENTIGTDYDQVHYADVPALKVNTMYRRISRFLTPAWSILALVMLLELFRVIIRKRK